MRTYKHKQSGQEVEAVTFDELVEHGRKQNPGRVVMPWSFEIWGYPVTHETDTRYFVGGSTRITPGEVLVHQQGNVYRWGLENFSAQFDPITETPEAPAPAPMELDVIEAAEKSAQMMMDMVNRLRGVANLEEENARLRNELERLKDEVERVKASHSDLAVRFRREWQDNKDARKEIAALKDRPSQNAEAIADARKEITDARKEIDDARKENAALKDMVSRLEHHIKEEHVASWSKVQAALPDPAPDDSRSLADRTVDALKGLGEAKAAVEHYQASYGREVQAWSKFAAALPQIDDSADKRERIDWAVDTIKRLLENERIAVRTIAELRESMDNLHRRLTA